MGTADDPSPEEVVLKKRRFRWHHAIQAMHYANIGRVPRLFAERVLLRMLDDLEDDETIKRFPR